MNTSAIYHTDADDIPKVSLTDKCIVIDLDQTLIATQENLDISGILKDPKLLSLRQRIYDFSVENLDKKGDGKEVKCWGVTRPHVQEFLIFCFSYFKIVAIWSAGKREYVEEIVKYLFKDLPYPNVVFTSDNTIWNDEHQVEKPLINMMQSEPVLQKYMNLQNTFMLDDNYTNFNPNPGNGILIPAYEPSSVSAMQKDDYALLQFKNWLLREEVSDSCDITELDKSKIFSTSLRDSKRNISQQQFR
jgi:hypothetical protein